MTRTKVKSSVPFFLYREENRDRVKKELGEDAAPSLIDQTLQDRWDNLTQLERDVYIRKHKEEKEERNSRKSATEKTLPDDPFKPTPFKDGANSQSFEYQTITAMPQYQDYSFERLRYEDYLKNNGPPKKLAEDQQISLASSFVKFVSEKESSSTQPTNSTKLDDLALDIGSLLTGTFEKELADVTLVANDDTNLPCHKLILFCRSPFFKKVFTSNPDTKFIKMATIKSDILQLILKWMYTGTVDPSETAQFFFDLFEGAAILQLKQLMHFSLNKLSNNTNKTLEYANTLLAWGENMKRIINSETATVEISRDGIEYSTVTISQGVLDSELATVVSNLIASPVSIFKSYIATVKDIPQTISLDDNFVELVVFPGFDKTPRKENSHSLKIVDCK